MDCCFCSINIITLSSALVLPWVREHTRIEVGVHVCAEFIVLFKVLSIRLLTQSLSFLEHLVSMEILVCSSWELSHMGLSKRTGIGGSVHHHFGIVLIGVLSASSKLAANKIFWDSLGVRKASFLVVVSFWLNFVSP